MKKLILILIVFTYTQLCFSQSKWGLGFSFVPGVSGLTNRIVGTSYPEAYYFESKFSYFINGLIEYQLNDKIHFCSGIELKKMSFSVSESREDMDTSMLNLFAEMDTSLLHLQKWTAIPTYYFISVPLKIKYFINPFKKLNVFFDGGICIDYLFDGNNTQISEYDFGTYEKYQNQKPYTDSSKKIYLGIQIGAGVNYIINNQIRVFIEPSCQYFIKKTENVFPFDGNLYNIGINVGVLYSIK